DGSILASGPNESAERYTLVLTDLPASVGQLRLEVLTHNSLPGGGGPGRHRTGNFHLNEIRLLRKADGQQSEAPLAIVRGQASHGFTDNPVDGSFDNDPRTCWHVWGKLGQDHWARYTLREEARFGKGDRLVVHLQHCNSPEEGTNLGRFRLSAA